jgi:SAM-dependent methyltransferase
MNLSTKVLNVARMCPWPFRWLIVVLRSGLVPAALSEHWFIERLAPVVGLPARQEQWVRAIMYAECARLLAPLDPPRLNVLEISPGVWQFGSRFAFKSLRQVDFPDFDICKDALDENAFDLIIADQVFEHLLWPYRAGRNVYKMLKPGGHCLITTPFLIRVHASPTDCSRWTEVGLRHLLAECGFPLDTITTGSWGNRSCVIANFKSWAPVTMFTSLRSEPNFPVSVWALARK